MDGRFDGVLRLSRTNTKRVSIGAGGIVSFATFVTGEVFARTCRAGMALGGLEAALEDATAMTLAVPVAARSSLPA